MSLFRSPQIALSKHVVSVFLCLMQIRARNSAGNSEYSRIVTVAGTFQYSHTHGNYGGNLYVFLLIVCSQ